MFYTLYEVNTGRVLQWGYSSAWLAPEPEEGQAVDWINAPDRSPNDHPVGPHERFDPESGEYVPFEEMTLSTDRRELTADGVDEIVFTDLPSPCAVSMPGVYEIVTDGTLTITSDVPHVYEITFSAWPYLPKTIRVEAV